MPTNFESHECVIFVQSTKIGTQENKAIHSIFYWEGEVSISNKPKVER